MFTVEVSGKILSWHAADSKRVLVALDEVQNVGDNTVLVSVPRNPKAESVEAFGATHLKAKGMGRLEGRHLTVYAWEDAYSYTYVPETESGDEGGEKTAAPASPRPAVAPAAAPKASSTASPATAVPRPAAPKPGGAPKPAPPVRPAEPAKATAGPKPGPRPPSSGMSVTKHVEDGDYEERTVGAVASIPKPEGGPAIKPLAPPPPEVKPSESKKYAEAFDVEL